MHNAVKIQSVFRGFLTRCESRYNKKQKRI
ncbi:MAG: hypothetical protein J6K75_05660, partial [Erysipelotrichaceae bacterium]|nr:hypothetical protein [Erysipelotrichaceae bacterium]